MHLVAKALGHLCTWSPMHLVTYALGHLCTWSPRHLVTYALGRLGTPSPGPFVTKHLAAATQEAHQCLIMTVGIRTNFTIIFTDPQTLKHNKC